ncbi:hypothetical protein BWZ20_10980 [Winogradskyella sp. J14-2]|uniref:hypothetical protein n=1 Tax=Winogradskyella sp. J14-2 TaxID=1936080 RepID=UPI000972983C|nr:hypothetical protein [Winogradskyella sp. J14-2]APY08791.1 hypothetical protein BWZ20_10980 [Winogradskyella sp. J14-2]
MSQQEIQIVLQHIFVSNFNIGASKFSWDVPLEQLDEDFKTLSFLIFLEQLVNTEFKIRASILEQINVSVHTPSDINNLILRNLQLI